MHKSWNQEGVRLRTHRSVCVLYTCTRVRERGLLRISLHTVGLSVCTRVTTQVCITVFTHTLLDVF